MNLALFHYFPFISKVKQDRMYLKCLETFKKCACLFSSARKVATLGLFPVEFRKIEDRRKYCTKHKSYKIDTIITF